MENSSFNRSSRTARTPPPTTSPGTAPTPRPKPPLQGSNVLDVIKTAEIQSWMSTIEHYLNEVCTIAAEGKLNSEQKLRITNLCRKVGNGTSQMAVQYQSLKQKAIQAYASIQSLQEQLDLSQRLTELKQCLEETKSTSNVSFADVVKKSTSNFIQAANQHSVAIYPNDDRKSSEETKSLVQKIICPEEMKLQIRGLRKTRNGGVIISTESKEDIEKLKVSAQLTKSGLKVDEPYRRNPRILLIGVPSSMPEKEVFNCLYHQNLAEKLPHINLENFLTSIKLSHKSGKKDADTCNYVIEVSPVIRKALIRNERVFVNWSSCPVRDFTLVTRCFKCQLYGHAAKTCRDLNNTCGHCGDQGHAIKECPKKAIVPQCATCLRFKKPGNHSTGAADCPARLIAERRYINSIDYGHV